MEDFARGAHGERPWTAADVPPGPYFHGTRFHVDPGAEFDLAVPRSIAPGFEYGLVSDPETGGDGRRMFWASTSPEQALRWAHQKGLHLQRRGFDHLYVWEVEMDEPEVDPNMHDTRLSVPVTEVMASSGRFKRLHRRVAVINYPDKLPS